MAFFSLPTSFVKTAPLSTFWTKKVAAYLAHPPRLAPDIFGLKKNRSKKPVLKNRPKDAQKNVNRPISNQNHKLWQRRFRFDIGRQEDEISWRLETATKTANRHSSSAVKHEERVRKAD